MVKETTSVLTLSDERVGSGGDDINLTTLTSLFEVRVGSTKDGLGLTTSTSLFNGRVGSTEVKSNRPLDQPVGVQETTYDNLLELIDEKQ